MVQLTLDVKEDWCALNHVVVFRDSVSDLAWVVPPSGLLDALEDQSVGVVHAGQDSGGSNVVIQVLSQLFPLGNKQN